jgi:hypothetical protein
MKVPFDDQRSRGMTVRFDLPGYVFGLHRALLLAYTVTLIFRQAASSLIPGSNPLVAPDLPHFFISFTEQVHASKQVSTKSAT